MVALAESNGTDPKSASGSAWQAYWPRHSDGASTIHSAELTSIDGAFSVLWKRRWLVSSLSVNITVCPVTVTVACMTSPGFTRRAMVLDGAGTSSNHALETTLPAALQSTSVPVCSSASEVSL